MLVKDLFKKPIDRNIQGVVVIGNEDEKQKEQELEEYVCTNEIIESFRKFFKKYRESIQTPTEKIGVWITGFFGSGKSHFLKIMGYLLENENVLGKNAIDYFDDKIKDSLILADIKTSTKVKNKIVLFNIDSKAKSDSKQNPHAIMDTMLRSFNESIGLCATLPWVADFERELISDNIYENFKIKIEELTNKKWEIVRNQALLNRDKIIKALVNVKDISEESARKYIDDQANNYTKTTEQFAKIVNDYCIFNNTRVIFLMDEVGQFIGSNGPLMLNLQTCVEDLGKYCRGQAWVVVTSQQELKDMLNSTKDKQNDFSKIQGRFDIRLTLSGANADEVIKKRILEKQNNAINPLEALYEINKSKLSNLIIFEAKPSWNGYRDKEDFRDVYPFVSYQFELLQKVFESIREHGMSGGKHLSQSERSLLSAFQESAKKFANENTNVLVPFNSFYSTIEQFIDYHIKTVFINVEKRNIDAFAIEVLKVLFMIKYVKEMPATLNRLATLMVSRIDEDKLELKKKIDKALKDLEDETLIQKNGEEYDFLTNEEQDVNRQINNTNYNEGEVIRTISDIIFDKIMDSNKYRFDSRYEFAINRYVDEESKGSVNQDNISIQICTKYNSLTDSKDFATESIRTSGVVVDLTAGTYIDELIRANKISAFKRNNSANMSPALSEIMDKKMREHAERVKRAEDLIRDSLRVASIYSNGSLLDIKEKEGKDRLLEALKNQVNIHYYKLGNVSYFYNDTKAISDTLNEVVSDFITTSIEDDKNNAAYKDILDKLKNDKQFQKRTTVKTLVDMFTKKPYGWRDLDVLGMVASLWKNKQIQIIIHDNIVDDKNNSFKWDFAKKNNIDTMIVKVQEKIDESILYEVKKIMKNSFDQTYATEEETLKKEVIAFLGKKKETLNNIKIKYGTSCPGSDLIHAMIRDFDAIIRSNDSLTVFNEVINRNEKLMTYAEPLEAIESFYRENSAQMKTYLTAKEVIKWFMDNQLLDDLSSIENVIDDISKILGMELPFDSMSRLQTLVFNAGEIKRIIDAEKLSNANKSLKNDFEEIKKEKNAAISLNIKEETKNKINDLFVGIENQYSGWFNTLEANIDRLGNYLDSSRRTINNFRNAVENEISKENCDNSASARNSKNIALINCVPIANKKIKSKDDVNKVLEAIKEKLLKELENVDEINID